MKLALSTDFGSFHHWERLIAFGRDHSADRLVFWGDFSTAGFTPPFLYPRYPGWLTEEARGPRETVRERMASAGQRTHQAGMEFWYCFQILMIPDARRARDLSPQLFNADGEPDMASAAVCRLIEDQIDELLEVSPHLGGLEMWIMECASIVISQLAHQQIPLHEICERIVSTVHAKCRRHGLGLSLCLHTAGGHRATLEALLAAARRYPDIMVTADNVVGDFHLHLPFNTHLWRAAQTNPVQVCFDLNGEYWGRNFYPTSALRQYEEHLEEARRLGASWVNGRISTGHDRGSPHANVLPSRRDFYPGLGATASAAPVPKDLEVCCFDTLGAFNAEFFCRSVKDGSASRTDAVGTFLQEEFGRAPDDLVDVFLDVEAVVARVLYAGSNYFNAQSVLPSPFLARFWALDLQLTVPAGDPFVLHSTPRDGRADFHGWPVTEGLRTPGAHALIAEKRQALDDTESLLARADRATSSLAHEAREFVLRQFGDLALLARAACVLLEVMAQWFYLQGDTKSGDIPDPSRLELLGGELLQIAQMWKQRQPNDEWRVAATLYQWHSIISPAQRQPDGTVPDPGIRAAADGG